MIKKMMLLALSVGALIAFAAPAMAQAEVVLTEDGVPLAEGAEVTATSSNLVTTLPDANHVLACQKVTLHFEVTENGPNHVTLDQLGQATTENCALFVNGSPIPATITDGTVGVGEESEVTINTWGEGETNATFLTHLYKDAAHKELLTTCHAEGLVALQGAASGSDVLNVGPSLLAVAGPGCATEGTIEGSFTLETNDVNNTPVELDFEET